MSKETYEEFIEYYRDISALKESVALLGWDEKVYLPDNSVEERSKTKATVSRIIHEKITSEKMKDFIEKLNKESVFEDLDETQKANVREATREFEKAYEVPDELVEEINKTTSMARSSWVKAKEENDFEEFLPWIEKLIDLKKEYAEHVGYEDEPYDALLDDYEPGMKTSELESIFKDLKSKLVPIVKEFKDREISSNVLKDETFDPQKQKELSREIVKDLGYDFSEGRIDDSEHPFTVGMSKDTRITNRYNPENLSSMFSAIHEAGHAMYNQNISEEYLRTPINDAASLGFSESQSRLWENQIGRSRAFIKYVFPKIQEKFPKFAKVSADDFHRSINKVKPSLIRTDSDEVTYNLHILLRLELELGLFRGEIEPNELPELWEDKMDEYLGIRPDSESKGVLQDIHWSIGYFGYFPTYTLGNLYSAQIIDTVNDEMPELYEKIENGNFETLLEFLSENIYKHGRKYRAQELCKKVTGEELNVDYFIDYLKDRYYPIYEI